MKSTATSVAEYLAFLPDDRRAAIERVRAVILENLDSDYEEGLTHGMIGYSVPKSVYPPGYHANPQTGLPLAALASQKNYMSLYLMGPYVGGPDTALARWFHEAWAKTGRKLDMGKSCIRFKKLDDLPLDVIGEAIRLPARTYIEQYEIARSRG